MFEAMAPAPKIDGLGLKWYKDPDVKERLEEDGSMELLRPEAGEKMPRITQGCAVANKIFLEPVISRMREEGSLKIPEVADIAIELSIVWWRHEQSKRRKSCKGRLPKVDEHFELPQALQAQCHAEAKVIKSLISMVKKQFNMERVARELWPAMIV